MKWWFIFLSAVMTWMGGTYAMSDWNHAANDSAAAAQAGAAWEPVTAPYPREVKQALQAVREAGGHRLIRTDTASYVVIGAGERSTGGYRLSVEGVSRQPDGSLLVRVREHKPAPGAMTTQAFSYPTVVLAVSPDTDRVSVDITS